MRQRARTRRVEALAVADELQRLAERYRLIIRSLIYLGDLGPDLPIRLDNPNLNRAVELARAHNLDLDRFRVGPACANGIDSTALPMSHLVHALEGAVVTLHRRYEPHPGALLCCLALVLPAANRLRFVAEAQGNLGDCERWWQRVDHLVCLALGMPRLAWMMWRDGRRGRV